MGSKFYFLMFIFLIFGKSILAKNNVLENTYQINIHQDTNVFLGDTIKRRSSAKISNAKAIIPSPLTTAGSACKLESEQTVQVYITASGGSGDVIEWFDSPNSNEITHTGSIFGPIISNTTTYYVQSRSGLDVSVRVPVVASIYTTPPDVNLNLSPSGDICVDSEVSVSATGGADQFEFSVDDVVTQPMSSSRVYTSSNLSNGQKVSVKSIYGVVYDGIINETAWGKGPMADNSFSAPLSTGALNGYVNSVNICATNDKINLGIAGKLGNNKSLLIFLDTKPGGFSSANYGDENGPAPLVNAYNYFNNNSSTFDDKFFADYCLAISSGDGGVTFTADIIELKTGTSIKTNIGSVANGVPSEFFAVNTNNSGINDFNLGFEVGILKNLIGYIGGDIKFFALTMGVESANNYFVTNSFLNPERSSTIDYGNLGVDFNTKDPSPVVVSSEALIPCFTEASITVSIVEKPSKATVGSDQSNSCTLTSSSLGGNLPEIGSGQWSVKSGPGIATFEDPNNGNSTVTVDTEGSYVFTWTITSGNCPPSTEDISVSFTKPIPPPELGEVIQPGCASNIGSFKILNYDSSYSYSVNPTAGVAIDGNSVSAPSGTYTLTASSGSCTSTPSLSVTIKEPTLIPDAPVLSSVTQPVCNSTTGSFTINNFNSSYTYTATPNVGVTILNNTVFAPPGNYSLTATSETCESVPSSNVTVNPPPVGPTQPVLGNAKHPTCVVETGSFEITNFNPLYDYSISPNAGVSVNNNIVSAGAGQYVVTASYGQCTLSSTIEIKAIPVEIQFEIVGNCVGDHYVLTAKPLFDSNTVGPIEFQWTDNVGEVVGTNSKVLNVSDLLNNAIEEVVFPLTYNLTIISDLNFCEATNSFSIDGIYCNLQKGISPDGNGSNDFFDLKKLNVNKLEIFNRYGIMVYSQENYTDQWSGQSNKGDELPSATYYYVMHFKNGATKTGWIYLLKEKE